MRTRYFALAVGIVYLLIGLAGFVLTDERDIADLTVDNGEGDLLGLFPVNVLHNLVHVATGLLGILAYRSFDFARNYSRGLAVLYAVLAVMGLIDAGNLNNALGLVPLHSHDIWLHALTAVIAGYFGFGPVEAGGDYAEPGGTRRAV
jgi:hypothetical protein